MNLKELCIQRICEQVPHLSLFIISSPLPRSLNIEIMKKYSFYKWNAINREARTCDSENVSILIDYDFEFDSETPPILRSALLRNDNLEIYTSHDYYCAWTHYYKLDDFNIRLCSSCFKIFQYILNEKNIKFSHTFHHFHESVLSSNLHELYHRRSSWCQNTFSEILFELKDRYDCDRDLHGRGRKRVKFCDT